MTEGVVQVLGDADCRGETLNQRAGDWGKRLALVGLMAYGGSVVGVAGYARRVDLGTLSPLRALGVLAGAIITPGINVLLLVVALLAFGYIRSRVPLWTCAALLVGFAAVVWGTLSMGTTH